MKNKLRPYQIESLKKRSALLKIQQPEVKKEVEKLRIISAGKVDLDYKPKFYGKNDHEEFKKDFGEGSVFSMIAREYFEKYHPDENTPKLLDLLKSMKTDEEEAITIHKPPTCGPTTCIGADIQKNGVHYGSFDHPGFRNVKDSEELHQFYHTILGKPYTYKQYKKAQRRRRILKIKKWIRGLIG